MRTDGTDSESTSIYAKGFMAEKGTSRNGAMTIVHPRHERWAAASVPVLSGRQWRYPKEILGSR